MKKIKAFTLAEALIFLLITTLLAAAIIPVLTKKHVKNFNHGTWICTQDNSGKHYVKTIIDGVDSGFLYTGTSCKFTPPANASDFKVSAIAGGGRGADGDNTSKETIYDTTKDPQNGIITIKESGFYTFDMLGAGSSGGGLGCGSINEYVPKQGDTNLGYNFVYQSPDNTDEYGSEDYPASDYTKYAKMWEAGTPENIAHRNYTWTQYSPNQKLCVPIKVKSYRPLFWVKDLLAQTTELYKGKTLANTDKSPYLFTEKYYPNGYTQDDSICWSYPGSGGHSGYQYNTNMYLTAGDVLRISAGKGGESPLYSNTYAQTSDNYSRNDENAYMGLITPERNDYKQYYNSSQKGGDSTVITSSGTMTAKGGDKAASRVITYLTFNNVKVTNYAYIMVPQTKTNPYCTQQTTETNCNNSSYYYWDPKDSTSKYARCSWQKGENENQGKCTPIPISVNDKRLDWNHPRTKYRDNYFRIPACVYDEEPTIAYKYRNDPTKWDYPELLGEITSVKKYKLNSEGNLEYDKNNPKIITSPVLNSYDSGKAGSGGYGLGNLSFNFLTTKTDSTKTFRYKFTGSNGEDGYVKIYRMSTTAGGGGKAGQYISRNYKKLPELTIIIGNGGKDATKPNGEQTQVKPLFNIKGGMKGQSNYASLDQSSNKSYIAGGNGEPSSMNSASQYVETVTPLGGYVIGNDKMDGQSPKTEIYKAPSYDFWGFHWDLSYMYNFIAGHDYQMTYGAGGGGGAASETDAGKGGIGAPGAVIIEW